MSSNEYNQLLKFLYFEGYADSYAEAEELLESMSDEEFEDLCEKHSFPLKPSERRSVENIGRMLGGDYSVPPGGSTRKKSARKVEKVEKQPQEQPQPRKRKKLEFEVKEEFDEIEEAKDIPQEVALKLADMLKGSPQLSKRGGMARGLRQYAIGRNKKRLEKLQQNEEFDVVVEYLFVEGFTDTIENAEVMAENISAEWVKEILEKFNPSDYKEYDQKKHRDERNPSTEWDAQEKDYQDSRGDIRDKHNQARGVKIKKGKK